MKSPHLQNVAILIPLEGQWDGSAHERLTLLSALEAHKARLVPDTERAENAPPVSSSLATPRERRDIAPIHTPHGVRDASTKFFLQKTPSSRS